jgi:hypothetical protein
MEFLATLNKVSDPGPVLRVFRKYGRFNQRTQYPFGNPVSISRAHLDVLPRTQYWITDKADGVRVCLVLTRCPLSGLCASYLMDRRGHVYGLPVVCDASYFDDSMFDCELVAALPGAAAQVLLLAFDVSVLCGDETVGEEPLSARLHELAQVFPAPGTGASPLQIGCSVPGVALAPKPMVPLGGPAWGVHKSHPDAAAGSPPPPAPPAMPALPPVPYSTDGYILTPEAEGAPAPGATTSILKVKTEHTLDLLWVGADLYLGPSAHHVSVTTITDPDLPPVAFNPREFAGVPSGAIVEVRPATAHGSLWLSLVRVRTDRTAPNHMKCVLATLRSALDVVTLEDVLASVKVCP